MKQKPQKNNLVVCACGCGKLRTVTDKRGRKREYTHGHGMRGRKYSIRNREQKMNEKNSQWRGNAVGYTALHSWIRRKLKEPVSCPKCSEKSKLDLANISQKYKRDLGDWEWLCRRCHMKKDGRLSRLPDLNKNNIPWNKGKKGLTVAWNKGLTKESDSRLAVMSQSLKKHFKELKVES